MRQQDCPAATSRKLLDAMRSPSFLSVVWGFTAGSLRGSSEERAAALALFGSCFIIRKDLHQPVCHWV